MLRIREASASEAASLSRIAVESKAHWGYSEAQLRAWRADLSVTPESIDRYPTFVAEADGVPAGFCQVALTGAGASLEHLWVRPRFIGRGAGRALLMRALECAREAGCDRLSVDADPNAEPFYAAFGAVRTGTTPAPTEAQPDRFRPLLAIGTAPGAARGGARASALTGPVAEESFLPTEAADHRPLEAADARAAREALEDRLYEFNRSAVGRDDGCEFAFVERDARGALVAGVAGWVWAGACEIRTLWVDESLRGRGIGRRLVQAAETHARAHGCAVVLVASYSFQAPGFYERAGYRLTWRLAEFPPGHAHHYLVKRLDTETL